MTATRFSSDIPRSNAEKKQQARQNGRSGSPDGFSNDWWLKSLAGLIPGFVLALGLTGLFAWFGPGGIDAANKVQFNMWLVAILWMVLLNLVWLCRTGWLAMGLFSAAAVVSHVLLWGLLMLAGSSPFDWLPTGVTLGGVNL